MSNELIGAELDAAVARACNEPIAKIDDRGVWVRRPNHIDAFNIDIYSPSTDWSQGGPIIERERIEWEYLHDEPDDKKYCAFCHDFNRPIYGNKDFYVETARARGPTPLIAAMRAFVASKG